MKNLSETLGQLYKEHRDVLWFMVALAVMAVVLLIFSLVKLSPSSAVVKVGYGDIGSATGEEFSEMQTAGGYRDGSWMNMIRYPIFALVVGVMHNLVALKLFKKRGAAVAKVFLSMSILLVMGGFLVLTRLLGES